MSDEWTDDPLPAEHEDFKGLVMALLTQANEDPERFTEWEIEFLESLKHRGSLSEKQMNVLQRLWNKYEV